MGSNPAWRIYCSVAGQHIPAGCNEGVNIKFTTRRSGIYEVLVPSMDGDELFDAILLEKTVDSMIREGKRNFTLDLSAIEYLYSDAINKILQLNRNVLDVNGRFTLLEPNEEVSGILDRSGLKNFLKVYDSEDDLIRSSKELIRQTTALKTQDVKDFRPEGPPSEFDDLRAEIGMSIGEPVAGEPSRPVAPPAPRPAPVSGPVVEPPKPVMPEIAPTESPAIPSFGPPPTATPPPQFGPVTPPPTATPPPQFGPVTPPPAFQPSVPPSVEAPSQPSFGPVPPDTGFRQLQPTDKPVADSGEGRKGAPLSDEDRLMEEVGGKKFPAGALIALLLVVLVVAGVGVYVVLHKDTLFKRETAGTIPVLPESREIAQLAVDEEPEVEAREIAPIPPKPKPQARPAPRKPPAVPPKSAETTPARRTVSSGTNTIVITSSPTGATVSADGKVLGKTPYTWHNPSVYGMVVFSVDKWGYEVGGGKVEYTGGSLTKHFALKKEDLPAPPPPRPPAAKPAVEPRPEPVATPAPLPPTPAVVEPRPAPPPPAPKADTGDPATIFLSSIPPLADVFMDGKLVGKTNIAELKVTSGTHKMKFVKGAKELVRSMTFKPGKNASQLIRLK